MPWYLGDMLLEVYTSYVARVAEGDKRHYNRRVEVLHL